MRRPLLFTCLALCACQPPPDEGVDDTTEVVEAAATAVLPCENFTITKGAIGAGQTAATLATKDLSGTTDDWNKYLEFSGGSEVSCTFGVGTGTLSALAVRVNYRGPTYGEMPWIFEAWRASDGVWVKVGDNSFAGDWVWTAKDLPLGGTLASFVSSGKVKVRYRTASTVDVSQLDQWVLVSTTSDGATTPPPSTTPPPPTGTVWLPKPGTTWQWQLSGTISTSVDAQMYDIDLFDAPQSVIDGLRAKGRKVICYFSAGSREDWRPDASKFPSSSLGKALDGWAGERWVDTTNTTVRDIMKKRLDLAVSKRCDGVEPDNVDAYTNDNGFKKADGSKKLTATTQLDYNRFLATQAHARGLSIGLKNDVLQVSALVGDFDWALNESCGRYKRSDGKSECFYMQPFTTAGKAVFHVEYTDEWNTTSCPSISKPAGFSSLLKHMDLDAWRKVCP